MRYYNKKNYQQAILLFEECLKYDRLLEEWTIGKRNISDYSKLWLSCSYHQLGNDSIAKKYSDYYMTIPFDRNKVWEADSLYNSIPYKAPHEERIQKLSKICELDSINIGIYNIHYMQTLLSLGDEYLSIFDLRKSKYIYEKAFQLLQVTGRNNYLFDLVCKALAYIAYKEDNILLSIKYAKQRVCIQNDTSTIIHDNPFPHPISRYATLAHYYAKSGNWDKALEVTHQRMQYFQNKLVINEDSFSYSLVLGQYSEDLASAGYYKQALRVLQTKMEKFPSTVFKYGDCLSRGNYNYKLRNYRDAKIWYEEALKCYPYEKEGLHYLSILDLIATTYFHSNNLNQALSLQKKILEMAVTKELSYSLDFNDYDYITRFLSHMAFYYNQDHQSDSAQMYEDRNLLLKEKAYPPSDITYAYSYDNLSHAYAGKGEWQKALQYARAALDIYKIQKQDYNIINTLQNIIDYYFLIGSWTEAQNSILESTKFIYSDIIKMLPELTYDERSRFVEEYSKWITHQIPKYAYYTKSDSIISTSYDALLLIKGILSSSENEVKRLINESDDNSLRDLWEELRADRYILSKQLEKDSTERKLDVDSLQKVIYWIEDSLIVKCKEYGDITRSMEFKWKDIQNKLNLNDIAVEFLSFPIERDCVMHVALTLRKDSEVPKMTILFEEKQLKEVPDTLYYQCQEMTDLVWKPLSSELQGVKNIYFSPSGDLYNIGIEYLPGMEGYNIYRLSSTRELVINQKNVYEKRAVLYGGLDYDVQLDSLIKPKSQDLFDFAFVERANVEAIKRGKKKRGGKEYLPHTKKEVEQIGDELRKAEWSCLLDTATIGTEESFKALSGKRVGCLHLATHGFYYTPEEADNMQYRFMQLDNQVISAEDKALTRSGLILSGANHILEGDTIPDNIEDGILTAKEIADIDLRGLDLVVLSACQTGVGDISQGEGVFGLQRGFKKAGANSILMSLWEVEDEASQILMTQFYKNLLSGQSKRQALLSAQKNLREVNGGMYDEPKFWAAYILLDGLK